MLREEIGPMGAVVLAVIAAVLFVLWLPVRLELWWKGEEIAARLWVLCFPVRLLPQKEKKRKPKGKKTEKKRETEKPEKEQKPKRELLETIALVRDMLPETAKTAGRLLKRVSVWIRMQIVVSQPDAGDTAIRYGQANAVVYGLYGALCSLTRLREWKADLWPDYIGNEEKAALWLKLSASPLMLLWEALRFGVRAGLALLKNK